MTRTALYLRISRDSEKVGRGIARQLSECTALAERDGLDIIATFEDNDISASRFAKKVRPAFEEMMTRAEAGEFDTLLAWDVDRLMRRPSDGERIISAHEKHKINVRTVFDTVDLASPNGTMFLRIKVAVAAQESDLKAARVKAAHQQRLAEGKPISGRTPFGWKKGGLKLEPAEADAVREGVAHVLDGGSVSALQRRWNDAGLLGPTGKPWTAASVKKTLRRWRNAGVVEHKGEPLDVPSQIEPIVSRDDLEALRARLVLMPDPQGRPVAKSWLSGVMLCGVCRAKMLPRKDYYSCSTSTERTRAADTERHVSIKKTIAERWVTNRLLEISRNPVDVPEVAKVREAEDKLSELLAERRDVTELLLTPGVDKKVVARRLKELAAEVEKWEEQRLKFRTATSEAARIARLFDAPDPRASIIGYTSWLVWFERLSVQDKRDLARTLKPIIVAKGGKGAGRLTSPSTQKTDLA